MRIVIDLRKGVSPKVILNQLFAHTQLQVSFGVINLALVERPAEGAVAEGDDRLLRRPPARRWSPAARSSTCAKAEERAHILQGLKIALDNIDEVIALIKKSQGRRDGPRAA